MKVVIVGHFGGNKQFYDGQTVKTKIIASESKKRIGQENVRCLDTYGGKTVFLSLVFKLIKLAKRNVNIVMLPAHNGVKILSYILLALKKVFRARIHYSVIGGWLPKLLMKKKGLAKTLKQFDNIFVETNTMKVALEAQGFNNIVLMPNCKKLTPLLKEQLIYPSKPLKLCIFSRIMKEKGVEDAINAVTEINKKYEAPIYMLDIYGPVDPEQEEWFDELKKIFPEYVKYEGVVPSDKSVDVLKSYYALLFPTRFYTEGVPGTIIDAYAAGVPVISARWQSFNDVIDENVTGIGYEFENVKALTDVLDKVKDGDFLISMKENCIKKAYDFMPQSVLDIMISRFC